MERDVRRRRMERRVIELKIAGLTQNEICRKLKKGDRKVRKILEKAEEQGYLSGRELPAVPLAVFPEPPPTAVMSASAIDELLLKHKPWVEERLTIGWKKVTVWEELPFKVGRSSFYRFLERHKLNRIGEECARITPEIVHKAGEALLVDWGKLRAVRGEDGKLKILWAFVGVLGFSRFMMVRLVWTNDVATTITALESMLQEMGGVAARVTSDNPKCFALLANKYEPLLNPVLERWSAHYGLCLECLPPADPKKKGKVERLMPYVRRLYEAHGEAWFGLEESQNYINKKVAIANERRHGTTNLRPMDVFGQIERKALKALPALAYEMEEFHEGEVRADGYVRFRNKFYSAGEELKGCPVVVLANKTQVSIYIKGKLQEVHTRITDPYVSKSTKPHHLKPHERVMQDGAFYIKRAGRIGPNAAKLVETILAAGQGFVDTRRVWGILSLDKNYKADQIDKACKVAYDIGDLSYQRVLALVRLSPSEKPAATQSKSETAHKFVRDLDEYKQLLLWEQKEVENEPSAT
jgi:hypothetical protein